MPDMHITTAAESQKPVRLRVLAADKSLANASFRPQAQANTVSSEIENLSDVIGFIKDYLWAGSAYQQILEIERVLKESSLTASEAGNPAIEKISALAAKHTYKIDLDQLAKSWRESSLLLRKESQLIQFPELELLDSLIDYSPELFRSSVINFLDQQSSHNYTPKEELPFAMRLREFIRHNADDWAQFIATISTVGGACFVAGINPQYLAIMIAASISVKSLFNSRSHKKYLALDRAICDEANYHNNALNGLAAQYVPFDQYAESLYSKSDNFLVRDNFLALRVNRLLVNGFDPRRAASFYYQQLAETALAKPPYECFTSLPELLFRTPEKYQNVKKALLCLDRIEFEWLKYQSQRFRELLSANICLNANAQSH